MMENDDKLISQFMHANKHEIEDNGFSRRVIRQLPGFNFLFGVIVEVITSQSYNLMSNTNFISLAIATVVVIIIGVQRVVSFR